MTMRARRFVIFRVRRYLMYDDDDEQYATYDVDSDARDIDLHPPQPAQYITVYQCPRRPFELFVRTRVSGYFDAYENSSATPRL